MLDILWKRANWQEGNQILLPPEPQGAWQNAAPPSGEPPCFGVKLKLRSSEEKAEKSAFSGAGRPAHGVKTASGSNKTATAAASEFLLSR